MDDSSHCHSCGHVIDQEAAAPINPRPLPASSLGDDRMEPCSKCGEMCRIGLVRCFNCGTFLRPEIEASFRRMRQSGKYEIEHVELPIIDASHVSEVDSMKRRSATPESFLASRALTNRDTDDGDDFELSSDAQFGEVDDDAFELNDELLSAGSSQLNVNAGDEEYGLPLAQIDASLASAADATANADAPPLPSAAEPPIQNEAAEAAEPEAPKEDELLKIASEEELDIQRVRKTLRSKGTFVIFCPQGCRIRVKEEHRGRKGNCPRCHCEFVVPKTAPVKKPVGAAGAEPAPAAVQESRYKSWMTDIRLHSFDPMKLRIKPDSLLNECVAADLGFADDDLLIVTLIAGKFGANAKKMPPARQAMLDHFLNQGSVEKLAAAAKKVYTKELLTQFALAQPTAPGTESLFANIPVFGVNRIAVRVPRMADDTQPKYLSFTLSEFRKFAETMAAMYGISNLCSGTAIPLTDEYTTHKCHVKSTKILELKNLNYYEKDPGFKLEVSGWKCASCGIIISEAARAETKLGGPAAKSIAKAKCPKCAKKYGSQPLYQIAGATSDSANAPKTVSETEPAPAAV